MNIDEFSNVVSANKTFFTFDEVNDIMTYILTGNSTEITKKFCKSCKLIGNIKFNWEGGSLMKCIRDQLYTREVEVDSTDFSLEICSREHTSLSVNKKILLGGFRLFPFKHLSSSSKIVLATITLTKEHGALRELLQNNINFKVFANQKTILINWKNQLF